jgi:transposase InsO family protein
MVQRLKALCPAMGKKRIAQILSRAGLHLAVNTVATMLKEKLRSRPANTGKKDGTEVTELTARKAAGRTVTAKHPNNVWQVDMTAVPISAGFWAAWLPFTMPQAWPFCWWVVLAIYSKLGINCLITSSFLFQVELRLC